MQSYIDIMERAVSAYSDERIREYVDEVERDGLREHGFARLCANIGILIAYGRRLDLKDIFYDMLDICCERMPVSDAANDFTVREICSMLMLLEERGMIDPSVAEKCRASFAAFDPWRGYTIVASYAGETVGNWALFNALSEIVRGIYCGIDTSEFVEHELSGQMVCLDENGMYKDPGCPMVYDLVGRVLLAAMLHFGYRGRYAKDIEGMLDSSAELTLLMQSPTGELPFGGRSVQFLHNEALLVAYFEMEAARNHRLGRGETAARFKGAAKLASEHILSRLAEKPVRHIKNRYGRDSGIGCEDYGYFNKYMVTIGSNIYFAMLFGREDISPMPAPATVGGYTVATGDDFHKLFLNHSGYFLEIDTRADPHYDANGLGRVVRAGCPTQICLSVPFAMEPHYKLEGENKTQMSICPFVLRGGRLILGASEGAQLSITDRCADTSGASASVKYDTDGESVTVKYDVSTRGVCMTADGADGFMLPAFAFDGERESEINLTRGAISIKYDDHSCRYSFDSEALVRDMGDYFNRNGRYRVYAVHSPSVHIEIE
ncbi:MAG: hypothetical protein IJX38_00290 [Clostridia bacterium]|nr:hypothetical protein [Clostridia bacterium]